MKTGTLFGIGVGPGDPELIPIKAVRILAMVDIAFTAASAKNDYSLAVEISRSHIPERITIETLHFPMSKNPTIKEKAWHQNAARVADVLESGKNAAFLTLGDPLTYSTFGYLIRHLKAGWPHLSICTIPGITSYQAAAAATNQPLVEGEESLMIMSGVHGGDRLQRMAEEPDNVVFLKAYRNVESICRALEEAGMLPGFTAVANCSTEKERIYTDLKQLEQQEPNYWTLIIAKKNGHVGPKNS